MTLDVLFRADGGGSVGLGHVSRCEHLVWEASRRGMTAAVMVRADGDGVRFLRARGVAVLHDAHEADSEEVALEQVVKQVRPQLLMLDLKRDFDAETIVHLRRHTAVVVLDHFSEGVFAAHAVIFPFGHQRNNVLNDQRWATVGVPMYHGADYAVLNRAVLPCRHDAGRLLSERRPNIVVSTGGSDPRGLTCRLVRALVPLAMEDVRVSALVGATFRHQAALEALRCEVGHLVAFAPYTPARLAEADLLVATFGVTTYEAMYLGIPALTVGHSEENREASVLLMQRYGATLDASGITDGDMAAVSRMAQLLLTDPVRYEAMSEAGRRAVDGCGARRIFDVLLGLGLPGLRPGGS